ncbi:hypothetical protein [Edaphobacter acidisoli]|uniref:hypothetical protein n=1 Tax=Edaphobacter acidisoli TaxID=2040573 RepID=UPI0021E0516D|nr:hypothetical protein [Edaphobacter acidisoli]
MTQPDNAAVPKPEQPMPHPDTHPAPIPDPEPAGPSLEEPDPAVFHYTPTRPDD